MNSHHFSSRAQDKTEEQPHTPRFGALLLWHSCVFRGGQLGADLAKPLMGREAAAQMKGTDCKREEGLVPECPH